METRRRKQTNVWAWDKGGEEEEQERRGRKEKTVVNNNIIINPPKKQQEQQQPKSNSNRRAKSKALKEGPPPAVHSFAALLSRPSPPFKKKVLCLHSQLSRICPRVSSAGPTIRRGHWGLGRGRGGEEESGGGQRKGEKLRRG